VKRMHLGWIVVLGLLVVGMIVIALSPKWRGSARTRHLEEVAAKSMAQGPPADPGQGKLTGNLERAKRFDMPIVAIFTQQTEEHEHGASEPEMLRRKKEAAAKHEALTQLAAEYDQVAAIVRVAAESAPASVVRAKVTTFPSVIIYGADHRERWREEGKELTAAQIRAEMLKLGIKPHQPA